MLHLSCTFKLTAPLHCKPSMYVTVLCVSYDLMGILSSDIQQMFYFTSGRQEVVFTTAGFDNVAQSHHLPCVEHASIFIFWLSANTYLYQHPKSSVNEPDTREIISMSPKDIGLSLSNDHVFFHIYILNNIFMIHCPNMPPASVYKWKFLANDIIIVVYSISWVEY